MSGYTQGKDLSPSVPDFNLVTSVLSTDTKGALCVATFLRVQNVYDQPVVPVLDETLSFSVFYFAWLPGEDDDGDDENFEVLVSPSLVVHNIATALVKNPGPYVVLASAKGAHLKQAVSVTVASLHTSDPATPYIDFSFSGAMSQLCPTDEEEDVKICAASTTSTCTIGVPLQINPCQDKWEDPFYIVFKLIAVPITPAPTVTRSPTTGPTHVMSNAPTLLPVPRPTRTRANPIPSVVPLLFSGSNQQLDKTNPAYAYSSNVEQRGWQRPVEQTGRDNSAIPSTSVSSSHHRSLTRTTTTPPSEFDVDSSCGSEEWMKYGSEAEGVFQFRYILIYWSI